MARAARKPVPAAEIVPAKGRSSADLVAGRRGGLSEHPAAVYLARLAPGSRRTMLGALDEIAHMVSAGARDAASFDWAALRYQHTAAVRSALAGRYAPATANKMLAALRGVLKEAWRLGLIAAEDYQRAADVQNVRGSTLPRGRSLSPSEFELLFDTCDGSTPADVRDAALIAVLYGSGLRRSEAVALDLSDVEAATGALTVRSGKGRKARVTYMAGGATEAVQAWLAIRGSSPGALFCPVSKSGKVTLRRMSGQAVLGILRKRALKAGISSFSPHDLRRTYVGDLLDAGADIVTVQKLAGHASVTTTARYDRRPESVKKQAADLLSIPKARRLEAPAKKRKDAPKK